MARDERELQNEVFGPVHTKLGPVHGKIGPVNTGLSALVKELRTLVGYPIRPRRKA